MNFVLQVLGGYFSDRIGGQRVIFVAAIGWSLITFWMPELLALAPQKWYYSIPFIVTVRILNGAFQGVHFPSMSSITSQVAIIFPLFCEIYFLLRFYRLDDFRLFFEKLIFS